MSSTFDTAQLAISWVRNRVDPDGDDLHLQNILWLMSDVVSRLHDYSHDHNDELNRGPIAIAASELRAALRQEERPSGTDKPGTA